MNNIVWLIVCRDGGVESLHATKEEAYLELEYFRYWSDDYIVQQAHNDGTLG